MRDLVFNIATGILIVASMVVFGCLLATLISIAESKFPGSTNKVMPFWLGIPTFLLIFYGIGRMVNGL